MIPQLQCFSWQSPFSQLGLSSLCLRHAPDLGLHCPSRNFFCFLVIQIPHFLDLVFCFFLIYSHVLVEHTLQQLCQVNVMVQWPRTVEGLQWVCLLSFTALVHASCPLCLGHRCLLDCCFSIILRTHFSSLLCWNISFVYPRFFFFFF